MAEVYEIDGLQPGIPVRAREGQALFEFLQGLIQVTCISLHERLRPQHLAHQRGVGQLGQPARFAQLLIRLLRPAEMIVGAAAEQIPFDRQIALRRERSVVREQRDDLPVLPLAEQYLGFEQSEPQCPSRVRR